MVGRRLACQSCGDELFGVWLLEQPERIRLRCVYCGEVQSPQEAVRR